MGALGVIIVVLLLIAAGMFTVAWRGRRPRGGPRTVADLVRLRSDIVSLDEADRPAASEVASPEAGTPEAAEADPAPVVDAPAAAHPVSPEEGTIPEPVTVGAAGSSDTPWARAARMRESGSAAWIAPPTPLRTARAGIARPAVNGSGPLPGPAEAGDATPAAAAAPVESTTPVPAVPVDTTPPAVASAAATDLAARAATDPATVPAADVAAAPVPATDTAAVPAADVVTAADPAADAAAVPAPGTADALDHGPTPPSDPAAVTDLPVIATDGPSLANGTPVEAPPFPSSSSRPVEDTVGGQVEAVAERPNGLRPEPAAGFNGVATIVPTPARTAGRLRRSPAETAAEQAAADLALLRTFGVGGPGPAGERDDAGPELAVRGAEPAEAVGAAQPVTFHVVGRGGAGISGAVATLHDDRGRETASAPAGPDGRGTLTAPHPGGFVLVTAAGGHQPGAAALTVAGVPVEVTVLLTRAASISGTVAGEDGPEVGANVVLVQDGETLDMAETDADGRYRFGDLTAGEYGLSVTAPDCEPAGVVVRLADEQDAEQDVELVPAGLPA